MPVMPLKILRSATKPWPDEWLASASVDDGITTMGEFGRQHCRHGPSASESRCNEESYDDPLPTTFKAIGALIQRFFKNVKGCG